MQDTIYTLTLGAIAIAAIVSSIKTRGDKSVGLWLVTLVCVSLIAFGG